MTEAAALDDWVGRTREDRDDLTVFSAVGLTATLDRDDPPGEGDPLPPGWHWLYFPEIARHSALGPDGHPARGDFLPPVALPRRMWGGNRLVFHKPLRLGSRVRRVSEIESIKQRSGRSGALCLVKVKHSYFDPQRELALEEWHDVVYRQAAEPGAEPPPAELPPMAMKWQRRIDPDPVLLFRYSALTFNGHRIHYDMPYVTEVEHYPGLIVHGPLTATLLLDLLRREQPEADVASVRFRAMRPLFSGAPFRVEGAPTDFGAMLWALDPEGAVAMRADVEFA